MNRDGMNRVNKVDLKGKGTMELSGGVLCLRWKRGAYIGIDVAKAAISALGNGARLPMLVEIQGVTHFRGSSKSLSRRVKRLAHGALGFLSR